MLRNKVFKMETVRIHRNSTHGTSKTLTSKQDAKGQLGLLSTRLKIDWDVRVPLLKKEERAHDVTRQNMSSPAESPTWVNVHLRMVESWTCIQKRCQQCVHPRTRTAKRTGMQAQYMSNLGEKRHTPGPIVLLSSLKLHSKHKHLRFRRALWGYLARKFGLSNRILDSGCWQFCQHFAIPQSPSIDKSWSVALYYS